MPRCAVRWLTKRFLRLILPGLLLSFPASSGAGQNPAQPVKVIVDTDLGFASDDAMALLILLQSDAVDLLGVTVVTGNDWLRQEVANTLRLLEIAGRPEIPVHAGAERPLVTSQEEMLRREALFGETSEGGYKGAWRRDGNDPEDVTAPDGRFARKKAEEASAVSFLIETIRHHPAEIVLVAIGPLTNVALAVAKDPEIASLTKRLVVMGGGIRTLPEFNFWMDPEAARIVLRAAWPEIVITPLNISEQAPFTLDVARAAAAGTSPIARYFREIHVERVASHPVSPLMYDQIAVISMLDPSIVTRSESMWIDVEIDHGPLYGTTLFWGEERMPPPEARKAEVLLDLDYPRFIETFLELMKRPVSTSSP